MTGKQAWRGATAIGLTLMMLASCAPAPEPPPPPPPPPAPAPPPPPPPPVETDWRDRELTPGDWSYRREANGSAALFGSSASNAAFVVRCEMAGRRIRFERAGSLASGEGVMAFQTTDARNSYRVANAGGASGYIVADTQASDRFLDSIAFTRGRFTVAVTGQSQLILPNWPEVIRVVEDCRG